MISLLETLVEIVTEFATYILAGLEDAINAFFAAVETLVQGAIAVLPSLPEVVAPPTILGWLNWFYPVGGVLSVASGLVSSYVTFLAVRWILKKAGLI